MSPASSNSHPTEMASSTALLPLLAWLGQHLPFGGVHLPRLPIQIYSLFCPSRQFPILQTQKEAFPSGSVSFYAPEGHSPFLFLAPFVQPIWGGSEILHNSCLPLLLYYMDVTSLTSLLECLDNYSPKILSQWHFFQVCMAVTRHI